MISIFKTFLAIACFLQIGAAAVVAAAGDLDATFGTGGKVAVNLMESSTGSGGLKAIVDPTGKVYQFGSVATQTTTSIAGIIRLTAGGTLDASFDGDGTVVCNFPDLSFSRFYSGGFQPDGKILAVGSATRDNIPYSLLARFLPSGQLDSSFGSGTGYVLFRNPGAVQVNFYWSSVAVQTDGKIVVAGALDYQMAAARFNSDGALDASFGTGGYRIIQVSVLGELWDMKLTPENRIVLVGKAETNFNDGNHSDYVLLRLTVDGALDATFGTGGVTRLDLTADTVSDAEIIQSVQLLPDGKILCFGRTGDITVDAVLMRFTPNGQLDPGFGTGGVRIVDYNNQNNVGVDMALQTDSKIVLVETDGFNNYLVQRLMPDGQLDSSFGAGGSVVVDLGGRDRPYSISVWNNKIIVAGNCLGTNGVIRHFGAARLIGSPTNPNLATLKGRAVNLLGRGIAGAEITLISKTSNNPVKVIADRSGNFEFPDMPIGTAFMLTPRAYRCVFQQPQMAVDFSDPNVFVKFKANCFRVIK